MRARRIRSIGGDLVLVSQPGGAAKNTRQRRKVYLSPHGARRLAVELLLAAEEAEAKASAPRTTATKAKRTRKKTSRGRRGGR